MTPETAMKLLAQHFPGSTEFDERLVRLVMDASGGERRLAERRKGAERRIADTGRPAAPPPVEP